MGALLRTTDGGDSWERLPPPPTAGRFVFADPQRGFLQSAPIADRLFTTPDGGDSWYQVVLSDIALYDLPVVHEDRISTVAVTVLDDDTPALYSFQTTDGGISWQLVDFIDLPAGHYYEPVPSLITLTGDLFAYGLGNSLVTRFWGQEQPLSGVILTLADAGADAIWALVASGECEGDRCRRTWRLMAVGGVGQDSRTTRELLNRSQEEESTPVRSARDSDSASTQAIVSLDYGFDTCAAPTIEDMEKWKTAGPFMDANVYLGGAAYACRHIQHNLDANWVTAVFAQGWRLIPTWVGPQAPCWPHGTIKFSTNLALARDEGAAQAVAAVNGARSIGLGDGTPIYYDMEQYPANNPACSSAVRAFVDAWSVGIEDQGYVAGLYGSPINASADWREGIVANPPSVIWLAHWECNAKETQCEWQDGPTVSSRYLDDRYWAGNRRIRQYWGDHKEVWGGVPLMIDRNYANGLVVGR